MIAAQKSQEITQKNKAVRMKSRIPKHQTPNIKNIYTSIVLKMSVNLPKLACYPYFMFRNIALVVNIKRFITESWWVGIEGF